MLDMLMEIPSMQFLKEWDVVPESSTLAEDKRTDQRTDWSPLQHSHTYLHPTDRLVRYNTRTRTSNTQT